MSEFPSSRSRGRGSWFASAVLHAVVVVLALTVSWRAVPHITFITLAAPKAISLPGLPGGGGASGRAAAGLGRPLPAPVAPSVHPVATPLGAKDTTSTVASGAVPANGSPGPRLGDGRLWPAPRPALPPDVADALYNPHPADTTVATRLRAMVDSLSHVIDQEQAAHRLPVWTTEVGGKKFGLDSSGIYVAGVKIPTAVLMSLGSSLPQGNFDEALRNREVAEMSRDLVQAARRTATLQEFRQYVREMRQRKQAERDSERRTRGDTLSAARDTTRLVP